MIIAANGRTDAMIILHDEGFSDLTPERCFYEKHYEKDGKKYIFGGWHSKQKRPPFEAIRMDEIE